MGSRLELVRLGDCVNESNQAGEEQVDHEHRQEDDAHEGEVALRHELEDAGEHVVLQS